MTEPVPPKVAEALLHVRSVFPEITKVTFDANEDLEGGFWIYETASGEAPPFNDLVDVSLLEEALDAAWEEGLFPLQYSIDQLGYR